MMTKLTSEWTGLMGLGRCSQEIVLEAPTSMDWPPGAPQPSCSAPPLLRFALAYGFRNIQSLMRKIKAGKCEYDYVEVGRRSMLLITPMSALIEDDPGCSLLPPDVMILIAFTLPSHI